jgi:hypothetical protein
MRLAAGAKASMMSIRPPPHGPGCELVGAVSTARIVRFGLRFWHGEQLAGSRQVFRAGRLGQKSVVTDAMEALWRNVDEEAADKLTCCERHDFVARSAVATIILDAA